MSEDDKVKRDRTGPLTPLKAAYKVAEILKRVAPDARKSVLAAASAECEVPESL